MNSNINSIAHLLVPYEEKEIAKKLGAKWDPQKKSWFVPDGVDVKNFEKWMPPKPDSEITPNIRSNYFYVVQSNEACWKCKQKTSVFGFLLPKIHEKSDFIEDEDDRNNGKEIWEVADYETIIAYVSFINKNALDAIKKFTKNYYFDFSKFTSSYYYMNHCRHCSSNLGDFYAHSEPGGAFMPISEEDARDMMIYKINDYFEANVGSYSIEVTFFHYMREKQLP